MLATRSAMRSIRPAAGRLAWSRAPRGIRALQVRAFQEGAEKQPQAVNKTPESSVEQRKEQVRRPSKRARSARLARHVIATS